MIYHVALARSMRYPDLEPYVQRVFPDSENYGLYSDAVLASEVMEIAFEPIRNIEVEISKLEELIADTKRYAIEKLERELEPLRANLTELQLLAHQPQD